MKKYMIHAGAFFILTILLTGFRNNNSCQNLLSVKTVTTISKANAELPEINIADVTAIQGNKGQSPVEVLIYLSQASPEPVTVEYSTENETAMAGVDYASTSGTIRFDPGETSKWITVMILGEVAADPDEDAVLPATVSLRVQIKKVIGALIKKKSTIINIIKNILKDPRFNQGDKSVYHVRMTYTGYTGETAELSKCPVRSNGRVVLDGIMTGYEKVGDDDPVIYTGTLFMYINIDICSIERLPDGQDEFCSIKVTGCGQVESELELNASAGYGYIKINHDPTKNGGFGRAVAGSCYSQLGDELKMIPNESISSIFNGLQLDMLQERILRKGVYPKQKTAEGEIIVEVVQKIR
ncbi:MAG TPA: Calx-beta domain-containing protein [Chitinophagaceae bacterium]